MRSRLVSALVYPVLLIAVAALVVLFLLVYVVPRFAVVLGQPPGPADALEAGSSSVARCTACRRPAGWRGRGAGRHRSVARGAAGARAPARSALAQLPAAPVLALALVSTFANAS